MSGRRLFDTNIVVGLLANDPTICERTVPISNIYLPVAVLGELIFGAQKSRRMVENMERIDRVLERATIIDHDTVTAYEYGVIRNQLGVKGRMIRENDIWIAAVARQHDLTLVSRDHHFAEVDGVRWEQYHESHSPIGPISRRLSISLARALFHAGGPGRNHA